MSRRSRSQGALTPCVALSLLLPAVAEAQEIEIEAFTEPQALERVVPEYPSRPLSRGEEGLVEVHFMVGADGRSFDPVVTSLVGSEDFVEPALAALAEERFEPARLNGEAIVGSKAYLYRFEMAGGSRRASETFSGRYRNFQRALSDGDRDKIERELDMLGTSGPRNHYENAYLNLARYNHAVRFGSDAEQMRHLEAALSGSDEPEMPAYLPDDVIQVLRRALVPLLLRANRFAEAVELYELMGESGDAEAVDFFAEAIGKVAAIKDDDSEYRVLLRLDDAGSVWFELFKDEFALTGGEGGLEEVRLHCEQQYAAFNVERDVFYAVPGEWGNCSMQLVGDSGAEVFLLQR